MSQDKKTNILHENNSESSSKSENKAGLDALKSKVNGPEGMPYRLKTDMEPEKKSATERKPLFEDTDAELQLISGQVASNETGKQDLNIAKPFKNQEKVDAQKTAAEYRSLLDTNDFVQEQKSGNLSSKENPKDKLETAKQETESGLDKGKSVQKSALDHKSLFENNDVQTKSADTVKKQENTNKNEVSKEETDKKETVSEIKSATEHKSLLDGISDAMLNHQANLTKQEDSEKQKEEVRPISPVTVTPLKMEEESLFSRAFKDDVELGTKPKSNNEKEDEKTIFSKAFEEDEGEQTAKMGIMKKPNTQERDLTNKSPFFEQDKEFLSKVDEAWFDRGSQKAKYMIITFSLLMVFFVVWAAYASIDEVARGQGQVIPSQRVQLIQHLEGGILNEVFVREGETVVPDQILARVDNVTAESVLRDTEAQILETSLALIRLEAELSGSDLVFPEEFTITAPQIIEAQLQTYNSRKSQQDSSLEIIQRQKEQKQQELNEANSRKQAYLQGYELVQKRVDLARPLVQRKLYAEVDFLNLQQEAVRLQGDIDAIENSIAKIAAEAEELDERSDLSRREFESEVVKEINTLRTELSSLKENKTASTDKVTRTELRSQVKGIVNRILLNTKGGVVKPGENIMEIVPLDDSLVIETKVRPQDIAFIHPNQKAVVRITAYDSSIYGSMDGVVEQIGADTITNEKGDIFFLVKVRTNDNAIYHMDEILPIMPGMVATVDILTGKKTVLSYLLKPITKASQYALKER